MNIRHPMDALHSISIKNIFCDKRDLKSNSHFPKKCKMLQQKPLKNDEKSSLFYLKKYFRSQLSSCILVIKKKWLDYKYKEAIFKIYDVATWLTNNYNTQNVQILTK